MEALMSWGKLGSLILTLFALVALQWVYRVLWVAPLRIREKLREQGIGGPRPSILVGNMKEMKKIQAEEEEKKKNKARNAGGGHGGSLCADYCSVLFPYFNKWRNDYGPKFVYSTGNLHQLYVTEPDLVREIALSKTMNLGRPSYMKKHHGALFGEGIFSSNGEAWSYQRKVIAPEFFMDKVKGMVDLLVDAALPLLNTWDAAIEREGGTAVIFVDKDLRKFSADAISRASFGSNYLEGEEIFAKLRHLQSALSKPSLLFGIPGSRHLPTKNNRDMWKLEGEIRSLISKVAKNQREESSTSSGTNLLQAILRGADAIPDNLMASEDFIVDNCKNLYFAGYETTAISTSWCLMLLASHPSWQDRIRAEVMDICQGQLPDADMLRRMKTVTMVIQEALRLFPPAAFVRREALAEVAVGGIAVPKGVVFTVPISTVHHDPELWGPDAGEFNPSRFAGGIAAAAKAAAYMPFGVGPRTCAGQNFAMAEIKVVVSLVVSRFNFELSPEYVHLPAFRLTVEPEFGVPLVVRRMASSTENIA